MNDSNSHPASTVRNWRTIAIIAIAAAILFLAIPITFLSIYPINKQLLAPHLQPTDPAARQLLTKWGRLHSLRTMAGLIAFTTQIGATKGGQ